MIIEYGSKERMKEGESKKKGCTEKSEIKRKYFRNIFNPGKQSVI